MGSLTLLQMQLKVNTCFRAYLQIWGSLIWKEFLYLPRSAIVAYKYSGNIFFICIEPGYPGFYIYNYMNQETEVHMKAEQTN